MQETMKGNGKLLQVYALKRGMSTYFNPEENVFSPVTFLRILPNRTVHSDGDLGFDVVTTRACKKVSKSVKGTLEKGGETEPHKLRSVRDDYVNQRADRLQLLSDSEFEGTLTVKGSSKGKGFQGCMKRWNFSGQGQSHGNHRAHRRRGSVGSQGGQVWRGTKSPGRMGNRSVTVRGVRIAKVEGDNLTVYGSVPGPKNGLLSLLFNVRDE